MGFLDAAEEHGKEILTIINQKLDTSVDPRVHNVTYEARMLKAMFVKLRE